ncbi:SMP-30/gluconolactonase/LRE family protein [Hydrogenophaga sp. SNF1]|uniref:SMP-30/gluconolactonase/LRE family protein n=1 Tax=Hydrogenophaga sp. SNF1 TaxID=3098762 RepID=UPI002ACBE8D2|nr:SMP-30/gluconolactonase/LRE family protein [Hydrogenophaga sp. SNF1]WQB84708.1 SMP-30/gluconolactonase/LRE family protein [Hydrogenophaga sp. SNF1]
MRDKPIVRNGVIRDSLLEGPSFDAQGNLWCVDMVYGRIFRIDPAGRFELAAQYDGNPNGLKFHADGRIFIADHQRGLLTLEPVSGRVETVLAGFGGEPFRGLNDLHFSSTGDLYFTDQGSSGLEAPAGRVFCLRADGRLDLLVDNAPSPNGIVLSADEKTLHVAVTRANAVWNIPLALAPQGRARRVGLFVQLSGGTGPDGLAMSEDGHLLVAHVGMGVVWVFDPLGVPVLRIDAPSGRGTTNLAFGGQDRKTLFITESASATILRVNLPFAGKRLFSNH